MTAQGSSQLGVFVELASLLFPTTFRVNGSTQKEKSHLRTQEILSLYSKMQQETHTQDAPPPLSKDTKKSATPHEGL